MYKILIIEDDLIIRKELKNHMKNWGYDVKVLEDFNNVLKEFVSFDPQLVLLDISLPFFNGYYWCSEIRKISKVPIIFISSSSDNMNIILAITQGADDFIAKPFDLNLLTTKVQALLRRTYDFSLQNNLMEHKGIILNINDATLTYNREKINLSKNEFKILEILIKNKGKIVSRGNIMIKLWKSDNYIDDNTLTVNIARIRNKLSDIGIENFITTKKGIGYMVE